MAAFVPGIRQNSTLLRLVRLLRIVRLVRVLPDLRVLLLGVWRSCLPLASIAAVTAMILFVYGMVGWILFADELPERWGNIGTAMLTLFVMLTLEDFPVYMDEAMEIHPWAWIYFVSFILVAAFIVLNVLDRRRPELDGGGARARAAAGDPRSASGPPPARVSGRPGGTCARRGAHRDPAASARRPRGRARARRATRAAKKPRRPPGR